ncbi:MAG TPA: hypothetical protein O0X23_01050 [Methanocorpusculum sp.]|nr:hypothetical protein [Methanocorpusculum sp.]
MKRTLLSVIVVFLLVSSTFAVPVASMPIGEPETISSSEALELRIAQGFTERFCEHDGIKDAIGYQYIPQTGTWNIVASDSRIHSINPSDDTTRAQLLEYMYYVDGHYDADLETIGALAMLAGGAIGILVPTPLGIAAAIITTSSAIIWDAKAHEDKNLCYSYAHKIADEIIGRC